MIFGIGFKNRKRERSPDLFLGSDDEDGEGGGVEDSSSNEPPMSKPKLDPFAEEEEDSRLAEDEAARPQCEKGEEKVYEFDESAEYVSDDEDDCERKKVKKGRKAKGPKAAKKALKVKAKEQPQPTEEPSKINVYSLGFEEPEDGLEGGKGRLARAAAGAVTAEGRLKAKLSKESSDGNLVKINLKKKTFVRGKKSMTGAKVSAVQPNYVTHLKSRI